MDREGEEQEEEEEAELEEERMLAGAEERVQGEELEEGARREWR
jgi:hypothetical protein